MSKRSHCRLASGTPRRPRASQGATPSRRGSFADGRPDRVASNRRATRVGSAPAPRGRRAPTQPRARETVGAILQASRELITATGYAATTTNHIAARAGVSVGSLYQYFPNKAAILEALVEEHVGAVHVVVEDFLVAAQDPNRRFADLLRELFLRLVDLHSAHPRLNRVIAEEAPHMRRSRRKHCHGSGDDHESLAVARLLESRPDVHVRHPLAAAHILEQATEALTYWLVHEAPPSLDREAYVDEAIALLSAYVTGRRAYNAQRKCP